MTDTAAASAADASEYIENKTYDEIAVGDQSVLVRTLRPEDIQLFAIMSGDVNPAHVDPEYARSSMFHEVIAHGMGGGALISTVLGTEFPGPGTIYISQTLKFSRPVKVGDSITITLTCKQKFDHNKHMIFDCVCTNQDNLKVIRGEADATTGFDGRPRRGTRILCLDQDGQPRLVDLLSNQLVPLDALASPAELATLKRAADLSTQQLQNARLIGAQDLAWALINNPAFLFNR